MGYMKTLAIKFIVHFIVVYSIFGIFNNARMDNLFWISLIVTGASFVIGDLFLLPRLGNVITSIADFPLSFLAIWLLAGMWINAPVPIIIASLYAAFFIALTEPFLHAYLQTQLSDKETTTGSMPRTLQTEFAEETDAQDIRNQNKD